MQVIKCCSGLCIDLLHKVICHHLLSLRQFEQIIIILGQFESDLGFTYELTRVEDPKFGTFEVCQHMSCYPHPFWWPPQLSSLLHVIISSWFSSDGDLERTDGCFGEQADRHGSLCVEGFFKQVFLLNNSGSWKWDSTKLLVSEFIFQTSSESTFYQIRSEREAVFVFQICICISNLYLYSKFQFQI